MSEKDQTINNILATLSGLLTLALPFAQFAFDIIKRIRGIFLDESIIFFTTITTFLLSIFVIFAVIQNKFYRYVSKKENEKYLDYLEKRKLLFDKPAKLSKIKVIPYPRGKSLKDISLYAITVFFITAMVFLWIGLINRTGEISQIVIFLQAVSYVVTFTVATFIIAVYAVNAQDMKNWQKNKQERIQRAINLAKENNAFKEFPKISFYSATETTSFPQQLLIRVYVGENKQYVICTDMQAEILYSVNEEIEQSEIPQDK